MKALIISAFALCLATAAPTALLAQEDHHDSHPGGEHPGGAMTGPSGTHTDTHAGTHTDMMVHHDTGAGAGTGGSTHHYSHHHNTGHTTTVNNHTNAHVNVDISSYRKNVTADRHYHFGDYHGPAGYSYHRWSYGDNLPREYWAQNYWITNFLNFGLIAPPDGYVWVRYGPDAVLIDENTGEIVQVEYGIFY